jgi:hypothetical protein
MVLDIRSDQKGPDPDPQHCLKGNKSVLRNRIIFMCLGLWVKLYAALAQTVQSVLQIWIQSDPDLFGQI